MNKDYVFLTVNEEGVTENVFATLGMAIDAIEIAAKRVEESFIEEKTISSLKWKGRNQKLYSLEIKKCPICTDVKMDYMNRPRDFVVF